MATKITFAFLVRVCYIINCHFTYAFIAEYAHLRKKIGENLPFVVYTKGEAG